MLDDLPVVGQWIREGLVVRKEGTEGAFLALTEAGMGYSDYLGPQLISPEIRARMDRWEVEHRDDPLQGQSEEL